MSATDTVLERSTSRPKETTPFTTTPALRALVLTCGDHRVDPAHVLGLKLGEAVVLRNPGGRVTPAFIQDLAILATIAFIEEIDPGFELIVMHHTDCGLSRLQSPDYSPMLAAFFGVAEDEVSSRHVAEPRAALRSDIDVLRANALIPPTLVVSGIVYDVETQKVEIICPPSPLGTRDDRQN